MYRSEKNSENCAHNAKSVFRRSPGFAETVVERSFVCTLQHLCSGIWLHHMFTQTESFVPNYYVRQQDIRMRKFFWRRKIVPFFTNVPIFDFLKIPASPSFPYEPTSTITNLQFASTIARSTTEKKPL